MEASQNKTIVSTIIIVIILVFGVGYMLFGKDTPPLQKDTATSPITNNSPVVLVENTPLVNGIVPIPAGFPSDIPLEADKVLESATTHYPNQNASQLSLNYQSSKTIAQKYAEYKAYMEQRGYQMTEDNTSSSVKSIFGIKDDTNLSVVISNTNEKTLVQLSYLIK
jgi:hypothetical protein